MPATHTLVIGAGQAGLAISRCLTDGVRRPRGARAGTRRRPLARPDVGVAAAPHAELGLAAPGLELRGARSRRLHDGARVRRVPVRLRPLLRRSGRGALRCPLAAARGRWLRGRDDEGSLPAAQRRDGDRLVRQAARAAARRSAALRRDAAHGERATAAPTTSRLAGCLVVGGSATGVQLADELARAGREVVLAVAGHSRVPRRYRGMDIWWWLDQTGTFAVTIDEVADPARARAEGALQLIGREDHRDVDLPALQRLGVRLAGRLVGVDGNRAHFAPDLRASTAARRRAADALAGPDRRPHHPQRTRRRGAPPADRRPPCARTDG